MRTPHRGVRGWLSVLGLTIALPWGTPVGALQAQNACPLPPSAEPDNVTALYGNLAAHYAPVLHFGPRETRFPVLPYFTAFDYTFNYTTIDTHHDSLLSALSDFERPGEVAVPMSLDRSVLARDPPGRGRTTFSTRMETNSAASWWALDREYARLMDGQLSVLRKKVKIMEGRVTQDSLDLSTGQSSETLAERLSEARQSLVFLRLYTLMEPKKGLIQAIRDSLSRQKPDSAGGWDSLLITVVLSPPESYSHAVDSIAALADSLASALKDADTRRARLLTDVDSLAQLKSVYARRAITPPRAAVMYRVQRMEAGGSGLKAIRRLLDSDPQALRHIQGLRAQVTTLVESNWLAFEYYLYYTSDNGLQGHPNDLEKFFVLVPEDTLRAREIRILIGNGHSVTTPNNVLILIGDQVQGEDHNHAIVELGGHSMSPDIIPWGQFSVGWDINWQASDKVWGVRDVQASTGGGYNGDYTPGFTLPRARTVTLTPDLTWKDSHVGDGATGSYLLLPDELMERLRDAAKANDGSDPGASINDVLTEINCWLKSWRSETGAAPLKLPDNPVTRDSVVQRIRLWDQMVVAGLDNKQQAKTAEAHATEPWEDGFYQENPHRILKGWLFRPMTVSGACDGPGNIILSVTQFPPAAMLVSVGDIPRLLSLIPTYTQAVGAELRIGYTGEFHCLEEKAAPHFPGVAQFQIGWRLHDWRWTPSSVLITYEPNYFVAQSISWYAHAGFFSDPEHSRRALAFRTGAGLSVMPIGLMAAEGGESGMGLLLRSLRLRVGVRADPFHLARHLGNIEWEASVDLRVPWVVRTPSF